MASEPNQQILEVFFEYFSGFTHAWAVLESAQSDRSKDIHKPYIYDELFWPLQGGLKTSLPWDLLSSFPIFFL